MLINFSVLQASVVSAWCFLVYDELNKQNKFKLEKLLADSCSEYNDNDKHQNYGKKEQA